MVEGVWMEWRKDTLVQGLCMYERYGSGQLKG